MHDPDQLAAEWQQLLEPLPPRWHLALAVRWAQRAAALWRASATFLDREQAAILEAAEAAARRVLARMADGLDLAEIHESAKKVSRHCESLRHGIEAPRAATATVTFAARIARCAWHAIIVDGKVADMDHTPFQLAIEQKLPQMNLP